MSNKTVDEMRYFPSNIGKSYLQFQLFMDNVKKGESVAYLTPEGYVSSPEHTKALIAEANKWIDINESEPNEGEIVLARLQWQSGKENYAILERKTLDDNAPWLYDGYELSFMVNVTHWKRFTQLTNPNPIEEEVKDE